MATSYAGPPPKKSNPLMWILAVVAGLIVIAGMVTVAGGLFLAKKVQEATANPALATAKLLAAANPDIEILSSDDDKGTVTFKERTSGKIVTFDFDQIKQGKLVFEEDGKRVAMSASGSGVDVTNDDGSTVRVGADGAAKLPGWLPGYPGAVEHATIAAQGGKDSGAMISFSSADQIDKIAKFYDETLKQSGLTTSVNLLKQDGKTSGAMIGAESADKKRTAVVSITAVGDNDNSVSVTYSDKR